MFGTIIAIEQHRGFGFVRPNGTCQRVFFHRNDLIDLDFGDHLVGERVDFDLTDSPRGQVAHRVQPPTFWTNET